MGIGNWFKSAARDVPRGAFFGIRAVEDAAMLKDVVDEKDRADAGDAEDLGSVVTPAKAEQSMVYLGTDEQGARLMLPIPPDRPACAARLSAPGLRRLAAGLIDRLLPLPFLIPLFWPWALVVLAYDLGRDARGGSIGKRLMGLETVAAVLDPALDGQPCTAGRSLLRNLLWMGSRLCYFSVFLSPIGFALDVTACLMALLTPEGRHLGDRIGGTRVVIAAGRAGGGF